MLIYHILPDLLISKSIAIDQKTLLLTTSFPPVSNENSLIRHRCHREFHAQKFNFIYAKRSFTLIRLDLNHTHTQRPTKPSKHTSVQLLVGSPLHTQFNTLPDQLNRVCVCVRWFNYRLSYSFFLALSHLNPHPPFGVDVCDLKNK